MSIQYYVLMFMYLGICYRFVMVDYFLTNNYHFIIVFIECNYFLINECNNQTHF